MKKEIENYRRTFEAWNKERTVLSAYGKRTGETYTYMPTDDEEFRPCYLEDTCENRQQKFFEARHELPERWWVSDKGTIVSVQGSSEKDYHVTLYLGQCTSTGRLQVVHKEKKYARETIVGLVFPDKMPVIDPGAAENIERKGLNAFRRAEGNMAESESIELHHVNGYIRSKNMQEAFENMKENCNPKNISFLQAQAHRVLSRIGNHAENLYEGNETSEDIKNLGRAITASGIEGPLTYLPGERRNTGNICSTSDVTLQNGTRMSIYDFVNAFLAGKIDGEGNILERPAQVVATRITTEN